MAIYEGKKYALGGDVHIVQPNGHVAIAMAMMVSPAEQARQIHNLTRYGELQKLRLGQPNTYEQTSYR